MMKLKHIGFLIFTIILGSCSQPQNDEALYSRGQQYYLARNYTKALEYFTAIEFNSFPQKTRLAYCMGNCYFVKEPIDSSIKYLEYALLGDHLTCKERVFALEQLGVGYRDKSQLELSVQRFEDSYQASNSCPELPNYVYSLNSKGITYSRHGMDEEAYTEFSRILSLIDTGEVSKTRMAWINTKNLSVKYAHCDEIRELISASQVPYDSLPGYEEFVNQCDSIENGPGMN